MSDISIRNHMGKVAVFTDRICYDFFDTLAEAEACAARLKAEDKVTDLIEDTISDLELALMADPFNLNHDQVQRAIKDHVSF